MTRSNFWSRDRLRRYAAVILCMAAYVLVCLFTVGCPIKYFLGIPCPGCGMTRALASVLRFDLASAFYWHPLWPIAPILVLYFLFEDIIPRHTSRTALAAFAVLFIGVYFYRIVFTDCAATVFDFENAAVIKIINLIFGG